MTGPVDVLAAWANDTTCSLAEANQRATVYAAVAELIEAGNAWCDLMPGLAGGPEFDRLTVALANVGGAK